MTDETYNGWKNYPTWAVNLWLSNDEGLYNETVERVAEIVAEEPQHIRYEVSSMLKHWVREMEEQEDASLASDLLGYAFDCVDWYEIADAWLETARDQVNA